MNDKEAQEKADKVQRLSLSMLQVTNTLVNVQVALELLYEEVAREAFLLSEISKDLPPKVQEKLTIVDLNQKSKDDIEKTSFVNLIRRIAKGESNQ